MIDQGGGNYNWGGYDQLVGNDVRYGLSTDAILMGAPSGDVMGAGMIRGLDSPVFSDGTDTPGAGKQVSPSNPYAAFVAAAVQRYMPGGTLAAQLGWRPTQGIRVWEAWNEPDLPMFWSGPIEEYARLLKVTYWVVHQVDPLAQVMFAGLAYDNPDVSDYLAETLAILAQDPQRAAYHWYFDIAAIHSYSDPTRSGVLVQHAKKDLAAYGLDRPIWLNESGIPVWDDYPGPTWTVANPDGHQYRGTLQEQALYVLESTTQAWAAGADVVFIFQLYDDCGNQPSGTDFAPNSGQAGDAYGLYRNDRTSVCFSQSPLPNTPRPAAAAYYRLAQVFGISHFQGGVSIDLHGEASAFAFDLSPAQGVASFGPVTAGGSGSNVTQRVYAMWNRSPNRVVVEIPASGQSAELYDMSSTDYLLSPQNGVYDIGLPPLSASDFPDLTSSELIRDTGAPYLLVEQVQAGWSPIDPQLVHIQGEETPPGSIANLPTVTAEVVAPTATPLPQPTTDPAMDTQPPIPLMQPLPEDSPATFTVHWSALDNSGVASYIVWVRINGGTWQKWLETSDTQADYTGVPGDSYEFALWAVDLAGNWSDNIDLAPQAATTVQP